MKKTWHYLIATVLVAGTAAGIIIAKNNSQNRGKINVTGSTASIDRQANPANLACRIFTLSDARLLLGNSAKGGQVQTGYSSEDINISTCNYSQDLSSSNVPVSSVKSASLIVKTPKTGNGIKSNQGQFGPIKPIAAEDLSGYGDSAYWDPDHGQLDILKDNTWYIISLGPSPPASRTLESTKQLADLLIRKM